MIIMNRGTKKGDQTKGKPISGEEFKKDEEQRLEDSGVEYVSINRGTSKIPVEKTKTTKKPDAKRTKHIR